MVFSVMPPSLNPQTDLMKAFNATPRPATSSTTGTSGHTPPGTPSNSTSNSTSATSLILPAQGGLASSLGTASLASSGLIKPPKAKKKKTKVKFLGERVNITRGPEKLIFFSSLFDFE